MQKVVDNCIMLTRGDTFKGTVGIKRRSGEIYIPAAGDQIRFALKKSYDDAEPLITKTINNETLQLQLDPEDTKAMAFGEYVYDIQITMADGTVDTFIDRKPFVLTEEVD